MFLWVGPFTTSSSRMTSPDTDTFFAFLKNLMLYDAYRMFTIIFYAILAHPCRSFALTGEESSPANVFKNTFHKKESNTKSPLPMPQSKMAFASVITALLWKACVLFYTQVGFL